MEAILEAIHHTSSLTYQTIFERKKKDENSFGMPLCDADCLAILLAQFKFFLGFHVHLHRDTAWQETVAANCSDFSGSPEVTGLL